MPDDDVLVNFGRMQHDGRTDLALTRDGMHSMTKFCFLLDVVVLREVIPTGREPILQTSFDPPTTSCLSVGHLINIPQTMHLSNDPQSPRAWWRDRGRGGGS